MINLQEPHPLLDEDTIRFFVWSVWNFFTKSTHVEPENGTPYLFDKFENSDYTGIIGVSGVQKGVVYFTMPKGFIDALLEKQGNGQILDGLTEEQIEETRVDFAGEITNMITGNVRNYLGEHFRISVPIVLSEPRTGIELAEESHGIVFPVQWNGFHCYLILNLEKIESRESEKNLYC